MPGAVYQLNVKGKQDKHLTGNPQHNFIKQVYKRYSNFAIQQNELLFKTDVDFGKKISIDIPRNADFLHKMHFKFTVPPLIMTSGTYAGWTNSLGHAIIDYMDLFIGGYKIDRCYGILLEIWYELTNTHTIRSNIDSLIGKVEHPKLLETNALSSNTYSVPFIYWFCQNIGSSLPLLSLTYHPIRIEMKLKKFEECIVYDGTTPPNTVNITKASIIAENIYIDDTERHFYINKEHVYLINQFQFNSESLSSGNTHRTTLSFNHPCSELIFVLREKTNEDNNDWFNFSQRNVNVFTHIKPLIKNAKLVLDGINRTEYQDEITLRVLNSSRYHSNTPNKDIYTIPLCNEPEKWYPTGTLNFSFIDSPELYLNLENGIDTAKIFVFARNYNIMKISDGMFRIIYSS